LIKYLVKDGVRITIVAPKDGFSEKLAELGCEFIDFSLSPKGLNPFREIRNFFFLRKLYATLRPDFVFHYTIKPNIYGSIAAFFARVPAIAVTTGLGYTFVNQNLVAYVARFLYRVAFVFPKEVWFLNPDDRDAFLNFGLVAPEKTVLLKGEGVNLKHFFPQALPRSGGKFCFLLIARMLWDKGVGEYVEAARIVRAKNPNAVFQLLGACDVPNPSAISRSLIAEWEKEGVVEYLGTAEDVRPIIAQADCVVLPSYREGVPRTMMESAAMAKPLIVSDAPGCREVVREEVTGYICPVKNAAELADCCVRMLQLSSVQRAQMGLAGRRFMEEVFDEEKVIAQYVATLRKYNILPR
ncbi:glycosyltransferase family 4 protein, partial [Gulbenkiania mobilis]|uniref:glycosyltransferase family 4 protein n=1 Tax=Gulbenkiania mobilis TaxID=397457 RepID=UPI0009F904B9